MRARAATLARVLTIFGAAAVTFMMLMYALERRGPHFIIAFACGCALSSAYGFLAGTYGPSVS
jgi:predicted membrane-bound mannosyltransferase